MDELDWSTQYTPDEWRSLREHYDRIMGPDQLDELFPFVPFMHEHRADTLKRYRLHVDVATRGVGLANRLTNPPVASLVAGHYYTTLPYPHGIVADLFVAKRVGGRRQEVADILGLAWLHSGMHGMNTASRVCQPLMDQWDPDVDDGPGIPWPDGWTVDPDAFRCGIDFTHTGDADEISDADLAKIEDWHRRVQGEVPAYVRFFASNYPLALKAFRARYETATQGTLPKQYIALCHLHLAAAWMCPEAVRRGVHMARYFGVERDHVVQILAFSQLYLGDIGIDTAVLAAADALEGWSA